MPIAPFRPMNTAPGWESRHVVRYRRLARLAMACGSVLLGACAVLPPTVERTPSQAIPMTSATALGAMAIASSPHDARSGFRLLPDPDLAFNARVELLARAEQSLDVQYYEILDDESGRHVLRLLSDAARRGVRVRLLVDDLETSGEDPLLLGLAVQPHVEVRLFNPFPAGRDHTSSKILASLFDLSRLQRRMHNKMMIADGAMAIVGGRNIGNAYFLRGSMTTFLDLDVLVAGAVVPALSEIFDLYWNSAPAYPIAAIAGGARLGPSELAQSFERHVSQGGLFAAHILPSKDILGQAPLRDDIEKGSLELIWANAEAIADAPEKVLGGHFDSVRERVRARARQSTIEVVVTTPYLIPGDVGMQAMRSLRERGVGITLVTNSLAAIDVPLAFAGYLRYRTPMLRLGVDIYEVTPERVAKSHRFPVFGSSSGRLHTKAVVIDRQIAVIGSMNLDPRSDGENTETALIIDSPELARQVLALVEVVERYAAYQVRLTENGATVWSNPDPQDSDPSKFSEEPETPLWERSLIRLLEPMVPESLL